MDEKVETPTAHDSALPDWGKVHCVECEKIIAYFPDGTLDEDVELEFYCHFCAEAIDKDDQ